MTGHMLFLASNRLFWEVGDPFVYPYSVDIDFREPVPAVWVSEGVAHGAMGAKLSISEALAPKWAQHFRDAEAEWLRPYLERMIGGEVVTEAELVSHFVAIHGRTPEALK